MIFLTIALMLFQMFFQLAIQIQIFTCPLICIFIFMIIRSFQKLPKNLKSFLPWSQTNTTLISHRFCSQKQPPKKNPEINQLLQHLKKRDEEERVRRIKEEEEKRQQKLEEKLRRIKKEEEQKQEKLERIRKEINDRFWHKIGLVSTLVGIILAYFYFLQQVKRQQAKKISAYRSQLLIQHQKNFQFKQNEFIQGKSIQKCLGRILSSKTNHLVLILGVQGIGKTSAIRKLINEKRKQTTKIIENGKEKEVKKQKQKVFYINLKVQKVQKKDQAQTEVFNKMTELITAIGQQYDGKIPTTLVIDDINRLEQIKQESKRKSNQAIIMELSNLGVKVILISSSTSFLTTIWNSQMFRKHQNKVEHIIWAMQENENRQIIERRGESLNISKNILDKVISFGFPLRDSLAILSTISGLFSPEDSNQKIIQYLENHYSSKFKKFMGITDGILEKNLFDDKASSLLMKRFINNKQYALATDAFRKNCDNLYDSLRLLRGYNTHTTTINALSEFDKQNIVIMCYPRSKFIMKIFQEKLKELQEKQKKKQEII